MKRFMLFAIALFAATVSANSEEPGHVPLREFLQHYLSYPGHYETTRYSAASVSLGGTRKQIYVYVSGPGWCGSGGCTGLLLQPIAHSFKVIDRFTLARLPVRILPTTTHGWHDLTVPVAGGGIMREYFAWLKFNGRKYPGNPSMAPALPKRMLHVGELLPLQQRGTALY